mgnify:CR=1 FL=1
MYDFFNGGNMKILKRVDEEKSIMINFRVTGPQKAIIQEKARIYTGGDVAKWIRYASLDYVPTPSQLVEVKGKDKKGGG